MVANTHVVNSKTIQVSLTLTWKNEGRLDCGAGIPSLWLKNKEIDEEGGGAWE